MSSRSSLVLVLAVVAVGCGRSPAARAPVQMVRVGDGKTVDCEDDDDDDAPPAAKPVEYVSMSDWQPPPSAKRVESQVTPRGEGSPRYLEFPRLTLHREIPATTFSRAYRRW